jgi:hypothetical protein
MTNTARKVEYFYVTANGEPEEAYELLTNLSSLGINLLAFTSVPIGPRSVQFSLFPADPARFQTLAKGIGLAVSGPFPAVLVQGADEAGVLARIHRQLRDAGAEVYASSAVTDGKGYFGYVIYVKPQEAERAVSALAMAGAR